MHRIIGCCAEAKTGCMQSQLDDIPMVELDHCEFGITECGRDAPVYDGIESPVLVKQHRLQAFSGSNKWTPRSRRERERFTMELDDSSSGELADLGSEVPINHGLEGSCSKSLTTSTCTRQHGMGPQNQNSFLIQNFHDRARGDVAAPPPTLLTNRVHTIATPRRTLLSKSCRQGGETALPKERSSSSPRREDVQSARVRVCASRENLGKVISFGDILYIRSNDRLTRLGATGGLLGHVLLVTSRPTCVERNTPEAFTCQRVWPHLDVSCIWYVPVIESTRSVTGLYENACLLYIDPKSGLMTALGDVAMHNGAMEIGQCEDAMSDCVEVFRCPPELRKLADESLMKQALADVKACDADWSWATAVRAFLLEGEVTVQDGRVGLADFHRTLEDIQICWTAEPICTSVVITFWQRYLCYLVAHTAIPGVGNDALAVILQYIPLKADRALPGELMAVLRSRNWETIARVPLAPGAKPMPRFNSI